MVPSSLHNKEQPNGCKEIKNMFRFATKLDKLPFNYSNFDFYNLNNYCNDLNQLESMVETISLNLSQMNAVLSGMQDTYLANVYEDALVNMKNTLANLKQNVKQEVKPRWLTIQEVI